MILNYLCPPALLYAVIMLIYLVLELSNKKYHQALVKAIIGIIFTCILQAFCQISLGLVSWILVMIPIIFYTYITLLTFFVFGLNPHNKHFEFKEPPAPSPKPAPPSSPSNLWIPSNHISSTPITTTLYTPSLVPPGASAPSPSFSPIIPGNPNSASGSGSESSDSNSGSNTDSRFSYPASNSIFSSEGSSNKLVPITVCTGQTTSSMCNSLSVCSWTGKKCINTTEFQNKINMLDSSCENRSDISCNFNNECYLLSITDSGKSKCLPSIPSIGELLNNNDCKTLVNELSFDASFNALLQSNIDTNGCSSVANKIYSKLV